MKKMFPVGATYAPLAKATEVDSSEWEKDIANFASLGLNSFRLFIAWDRIEVERGRRDFSKVDLAFELAKKYSLNVVANVGGTFTNLQAIYPPRWLYYECGCALVRETPNAPEELLSNRMKLCYDDPACQDETRNFICDAVARYKDHPNLFAWSGWNEPRISICYCRHTVALFREWLQLKYHSLEKLSRAWSTEFPVNFKSWDEVFPQPQTGFEHGGYIPWLDFQTFSYENRRNKFNMVLDWIKSVDNKTPVISHLCSGGTEADIFGKEDICGTSNYTYFKNGKEIFEWEDDEYCDHLNWMMAQMYMSRQKHRLDSDGFWVVETEGGPVWWLQSLKPRTYSPEKMNARDVLFVAQGARALYRWKYRSRISDAQAGEFNLVGWDGTITERAVKFGELSLFLNKHADILLNHKPMLDKVGIWTPDNADRILYEAEDMSLNECLESQKKLYCCLRHCGFSPKIYHDKQLVNAKLSEELKVLIVPFHPYISEQMGKVIERFVADGGMIITQAPFAIKNHCGIHYETTPGAGLDKVFGLQVYDMEKLFDASCGTIPAQNFKAVIRTTTAEVKECFNDGKPALIKNNYGLGQAVMFGSEIFTPYTYENGKKLRDFLISKLEEYSLCPSFHFVKGHPVPPEISIHFSMLPNAGKIIFVINMSKSANSFKIKFAEMEKISLLGTSNETNHFSIEKDGVKMNLTEYGWNIFIIK
jgi:beta-galactosidase